MGGVLTFFTFMARPHFEQVFILHKNFFLLIETVTSPKESFLW